MELPSVSIHQTFHSNSFHNFLTPIISKPRHGHTFTFTRCVAATRLFYLRVATVFVTHNICASGYRAAETPDNLLLQKLEKTEFPVPRVPYGHNLEHNPCKHMFCYHHATRSSGAAAAYLHFISVTGHLRTDFLLHALTNHIQPTTSVHIRAQGENQSSSKANSHEPHNDVSVNDVPHIRRW
jgi:hypothetical protein